MHALKGQAVAVNWGEYEPHDYPSYLAQNDLPRPEARRVYSSLMRIKTGRIDQLRGFLKLNGIELDNSDHAVRALNEWVRFSVEADPSEPRELPVRWVSVLNDVALYLGELMIARNPGLRWELFVWGKKNIAYQHHVIMGFSKVEHSKYNVDLDRMMLNLGYRIIFRADDERDIAGEDERDINLFLRWLGNAATYA